MKYKDLKSSLKELLSSYESAFQCANYVLLRAEALEDDLTPESTLLVGALRERFPGAGEVSPDPLAVEQLRELFPPGDERTVCYQLRALYEAKTGRTWDIAPLIDCLKSTYLSDVDEIELG